MSVARQWTLLLVCLVWASSASLSHADLWTPADMTNGPVAWYDAADTNTIHTNDAVGFVSQWDDKSTNAYHVSQISGTEQPAYSATGFNGKPTITFDGLDTDLNISAAAMTVAQPLHVFEVCQYKTKINKSVMRDSATTAKPFVFYNGEGGATWAMNSGASILYGTPDLSRHQHYHLYDGTHSYWGIDGSDPTGPANAGANSLQGLYIGGIRNDLVAGYAFQGDLSELIFVQGTLTEADRQKIEGYLAWKWGLQGDLPADHPYKAKAPRSGPTGTLFYIR